MSSPEKEVDRHKWVIDIEEAMKDMDPSKEPDRWKRMSIFKVPPNIRSLNIDAYKPRVVSFGPYHHGKEHLKPMEAHKRRALFHFLKRSNCSLKDCCDTLEEVIVQLMEQYEHLDEEWRDKDRFLELMVIDGCFLHEFLLNNEKHFDDYNHYDPIFGRQSIGSDHYEPIVGPQSIESILLRNIRRDMFLIENQLPLLVVQRLQALSACEGQHEENIWRALKEDILRKADIFNKADFFGVSSSFLSRDDPSSHVLNVLWDATRESDHEPRRSFEFNATFPSATVLSSIGVKFDFWLDRCPGLIPIKIRFRTRGQELTLSSIVVDEDSEAKFLNLIALEQLHQVSKGQPVSSYVAFMGLLIRSADDVKLLRDCNVINHSSTLSDRAIAKLFNDLAKNPMVRPDYSLAAVRMDLKDYYENGQNTIALATRKVNEKMADWGSYFKQTYCRNPWTFMGLAAAIILLVLTAIQTIYAVIQFYRGNG